MNDNDKPKSKSSVTSFVCGIISIFGHLVLWIGMLLTYMEVKQGFIFILASFPFNFLQVPLEIIAIVFGAMGISKTKSKLAKAGFIFGIIGAFLSIIYYIQVARTVAML